jgi:hypothetical protein
MAIIKSLEIRESGRRRSRTEICAEYSSTKNLFSLCSFRESDINGIGNASQNMQFTKEIAEILYDALGKFLGK